MADDPHSLGYQALPPADVLSITRSGRQVFVELPPISTSGFVAMILPALMWLTLSMAIATWLVGYHYASLRGWILASVGVAVSIVNLWRMCRRGGIRRRLWASPTQIGYIDARSGSHGNRAASQAYCRLSVGYHFGRPWVFCLSTRPKTQARWITSTTPFIMAVDADRGRLERVAAILEAARSSADDGHVRGAFEVVPTRDPAA